MFWVLLILKIFGFWVVAKVLKFIFLNLHYRFGLNLFDSVFVKALQDRNKWIVVVGCSTYTEKHYVASIAAEYVNNPILLICSSQSDVLETRNMIKNNSVEMMIFDFENGTIESLLQNWIAKKQVGMMIVCYNMMLKSVTDDTIDTFQSVANSCLRNPFVAKSIVVKQMAIDKTGIIVSINIWSDKLNRTEKKIFKPIQYSIRSLIENLDIEYSNKGITFINFENVTDTDTALCEKNAYNIKFFNNNIVKNMVVITKSANSTFKLITISPDPIIQLKILCNKLCSIFFIKENCLSTQKICKK